MKKFILLSLMLWGVAYGQSKLYLRGDSIQMQSGTNAELILLNGTRSVTNGLLQNIGNGRTRFVSLDSITTAPLANNGATLSGDTVQLGGTLTKATTIEGLNFPVEWTFNTLGASTGYKISSTSTVNPTTLQRLLEVSLSGATTGAGKSTTGLYVSNTHTYSGLGYSTSKGIEVVVGDTIDTNALPLGIHVKSYANNSDATNNGGILVEYYDDYSAGASSSFGIKSIISGGFSNGGAALIAINTGSNPSDPSIINKTMGVSATASGIFTGHNVGGYFDAQNGRRNFALVTRAASSFMTAGDSTDAILGIGAADSARASLIIEEASQDFEDFRDGAIWHFNDTLWGRFGGTTYNLLSGEGGAGSQDLQQTLDNGTWLDKANTINQDGFPIQWNGPNIWNDTTVTQISQRSFNSGVDYFIYTPIAQDTVVDVEMNVIDGFKAQVTNGTETNLLQVNGTGTFIQGSLTRIYNDDGTERLLEADGANEDVKIGRLSASRYFQVSDSIRTVGLPISNDTTTYKIQVVNPSSGANAYANWPVGSGTVTSVGLTAGTSGTDVNISGSPITTSGSITLNIPDASASARGLITTGTQTIAGAKSFSTSVTVPAGSTGSRTLNVGGAALYSPGSGILEGSEFWTIKATNARHLIGESSTTNLWGALAWDHTNNHLRLYHSTVGASDQIGIFGNGNVGIGVTAATGRLHLAAGTATASTGPLKFTSGTLTTAAEAGLNEYNGNFYATKVNDVRFGVGGALHNNVTSDAVTGSGAEDLMTYSVPAGTLSTDGSYIEVKAVFNFVTTGQTITIDFGGTSVVSYTSVNTGNYYVEGTITRTGAATQMAYFKVVGEDNAVYITTPAETLSGAITLKGTGDGIGAGDITQYQLNVKYFPN